MRLPVFLYNPEEEGEEGVGHSLSGMYARRLVMGRLSLLAAWCVICRERGPCCKGEDRGGGD